MSERSLPGLFETFLIHYGGEDFTAGREEMVRLKRETSGDIRRVATAMALFFTTLESVESSYLYRRAERRFRCAARLLEGVAEERGAQTLRCVMLFCEIEIAKLAIDRHTYGGRDRALLEAARTLRERVEALKGIVANLEGIGGRALEILLEKSEALERFGEAMVWIAESYLRRWEGKGNLAFFSRKKAIEKAIGELGENRILAYDLKSHLPVLERFASLEHPLRPVVTDGRIRYLFFAVVNYKIKEAFDDLLRRRVRMFADAGDGFGFLGSRPHEEMMEDLWSGLKAKDFTKKSVWPLGELRLKDFPRVGDEARFSVALSYFNMGVFALSLELDLAEAAAAGRPVGVTEYRHLLSLGNSFALDERFEFVSVGGRERRRFRFLQEFGRFVFDRFNAADFVEPLRRELAKYGHEGRVEAPLFYDTNEFVAYTVADLCGFECLEGRRRRRCDLSELSESVGFKGLILGAREVRPAIDDWILKRRADFENLAVYRYNEGELIRVEPSHAVLVLPQQPEWARQQAVESLEVGLAVNQLLVLNVALYNTVLGWYRDGFAERVQMLGEKRVLEHLERAENNINLLLETLGDGSMTQFPDHERFMERLIDNLRIAQTRARATAVLAKVRKIGEKIGRQRQAKREMKFRAMFALATSLLSAAALSDIFGVINQSDFSLFPRLSADTQFGLIIVATLIIFFATLKYEKEGK